MAAPCTPHDLARSSLVNHHTPDLYARANRVFLDPLFICVPPPESQGTWAELQRVGKDKEFPKGPGKTTNPLHCTPSDPPSAHLQRLQSEGS